MASVVTAEVSCNGAFQRISPHSDGSAGLRHSELTPLSSCTSSPVSRSVTSACSLRVEMSQEPSPDSVAFPPVWIGA